MYPVSEALANVDRNLMLVLVLSAFGWIGGTVQFFEGLRLTRRDRVIGQPLGYLALVFAHDSYFVLSQGTLSVDNWYFDATAKLFTVWPFFEAIAICWLVTVARREFAPDLRRLTWYSIYALYQGLAIALYVLVQSWIDDPLRLTGWTFAQIVNIVFMIPLALRRKSTLGQSRIMAWALLLSPGSTALFLAVAIAPSLLTPAYWVGAILTFTMSLAYLLLYEHYRRQETQRAMS